MCLEHISLHCVIIIGCMFSGKGERFIKENVRLEWPREKN